MPNPQPPSRAYTTVLRLLPLALILVGACLQPAEVTSPPLLEAPPETRQDNVVDTLHGKEITDPYRWLEDQESPETRAWIEEQNAYTDRVLADLPDLTPLRNRFAELLRADTVGVPVHRGGRYFYTRRDADQDLSVIFMREGLDGEEQVLLDPHAESEDNSVSYALRTISEDGTLVSYGVRQGGEDELSIRFYDVDKRSNLDDVLPKGRYSSIDLSKDKRAVYYGRFTEQGPRLFYHRLGTDPAQDPVIFGEGYGVDKLLYAGLSEDGRYLTVNILHGSSADRTEVFLQDLRGAEEWRTVVDDLDSRFFGGVSGGTLYLQTIWEAPNGRVLAADPAKPGRENWREVVAERPEAVLRSVSAVGGKIIVNYLEDVRSRVVVYDGDGQELGEIELGELGSVAGVSGEWDSPELFYRFVSFHVPSVIYRYDLDSGEQVEWARRQVPVDSDRIAVNQEWYTSKDGTRVPMFVVHAKDMERDGNRPTLLTGYGGFNASRTPGFSSSAVAWVEQGGVYAVANLRGGGEFGEAWHKAGMGENKQNVFDDFIAAAEHLIESGYTKPERLAIRGGSNGGLLVSAVSNQRPDLFAAVICSYPLLDMVRFHKFMMGPYWIAEYGSADNAEEFEYLHAYSPYHNVETGTAYPATLYITGDGDTRVAPLHARKMAALMQARNGSENPILLRYHTKAGHSGGQPVSEQIDNLSESYGFLLWQLGV